MPHYFIHFKYIDEEPSFLSGSQNIEERVIPDPLFVSVIIFMYRAGLYIFTLRSG